VAALFLLTGVNGLKSWLGEGHILQDIT